MSTSNVIVVPVASDAAEKSRQDTTEIASTVQHALEEKAHPHEEQPGPFKQIIAHQESLYQYINWEDPARTLCSYIGALSLLFGVHYLPLTQMVLKGGATALGLVSVTESASRMLGNRSLFTQLRPKDYKTFPEPTLNATLKDVHDFIQYAAVQVQRIVFGQDLQNTFLSFLSLTALYWLVKAVSPFWLAVMALTLVYAAPLIASPRGRDVIHEAGTQAQEIATCATQTGRTAAQDASVNAQRLANAATETGRAAVHDASTRIESLANSTQEAGRAATTSITSSAQSLLNQSNELAQKGKNKATNLSEQAKDTAFHVTEAATNTVKHTQQAGSNATQETADAASTAANAKHTTMAIPSTDTNTNSNISGPVRPLEADRTTNRRPDASYHEPPPAHQYPYGAVAPESRYAGAAVTDASAVERGGLERPRGMVAHAV